MSQYQILIIDDDPNIRKLLGELLAPHTDWKVLIAGDGKEAVSYFVREKIDVVLTDIHMPGFTGIELMADMQKVKFKPEIIVMTANATPENVEKARQIGARSVILKPFDNLDVVEGEVEKAVRAVAEARGSAEAAAPAAGPQPAPAAPVPRAAAPLPPAPPRAAAPPPPAPSRAPSARPPVPGVAKAAAAPPAPEPTATLRLDMPDFDAWKKDLSGNEIPPPPTHAVDLGEPEFDAEAPPGFETTAIPEESEPAPAPPAPKAAAPRSAPAGSRPAPPAPAQPAGGPAGTYAAAAVAARTRALDGQGSSRSAASDLAAHAAPARAAAPMVVPDAEAIPDMPSDLDDIFQMVATLDLGKMRMQVPIICLQTLEERGAIDALRAVAARLGRGFYTWSAVRGLAKDDGHLIGEMYRDPVKALEFIRRQKESDLYLLADFRQCLEDRTVVRVLREMVMGMETSKHLLVLTAPRLPVPPELQLACAAFDWPKGSDADLAALYEEVMSEVSASAGRAIRLDRAAREAIMEKVREMPAGRARFEIARALMAVSKKAS
jgi:CheY-like chemotaxis protein